jgi:hypothetical protein
MSFEFYRVLHACGALLLFLSLGGILLTPKDQKPAKLAMILHGVALLIMVVAGVGTVHKSADTAIPLKWGAWLYAKIGCWVLLAILPVLIKKGLVPRFLGLLLAIAAGAAAVWIAMEKPF